MRKVKKENKIEVRISNRLELVDKAVEVMFEKSVTQFGTGAKIDCPKEHLGKDAYVIIRRKK